MKHDECYDQPTNMANAGTVTPKLKMSDGDTKDDALGTRDMYTRNETSVAVERSNSTLDSLRDKQLNSNFNQSNGFSSRVAEHNNPAPTRGFNKR